MADDPEPFLSFAAISVGHSVAILREIVTGHLLTYAWLLLHGLPRTSRRWYLADDAKRFKTKFASHPDADLILAKLRETEDPLFWTIWERANPALDVVVRQLVKGKSRKRLTVPTLRQPDLAESSLNPISAPDAGWCAEKPWPCH